MNETKSPKSCWDCKHSSFGDKIVCVARLNLIDIYDYDKSIYDKCPLHYNKKENGDTENEKRN